MQTTFVYVISFLIFAANSDAAECASGWAAYKGEFCIRILDSFVTHDEAREHCSSQGDAMSKASLVIIKDAEMQAFLTDYTHDTYDTLWLGGRGKYDEESSQFTWDDGDALTYTNWQEGYPRNITDPDSCIELRPANSKLATKSDGNWANVVCQKRNLAICQKTLSWTLGDAVNEIIRVRNHLEDVNSQLREELETAKLQFQQELATVNARVVPVGSIYVEYYDQPSPTTLWPDLTWEDITDTYAGLFFRASGRGSGNWGAIQSECAPRITQMQYEQRIDVTYPNPFTIPENGWSEYGHIGSFYWNSQPEHYEAGRFYTEGCEVRPINQAIKVWKRLG